MAICPCKVIGPCGHGCTCVNPHMSGGCRRCASYGSKEQRGAACRRIAAKIDAWEVMQRRGWYVVPLGRHKIGVFWIVRCADGCDLPLAFRMQHSTQGEFSDPYTALVEADEWMKEREGQPSDSSSTARSVNG